MGSLDGEVAVVTGARHGIGAGIADGLAAAGARVAAPAYGAAHAATRIPGQPDA
jgi:NAD(P)-dependent dehydrogenase (short-subunit alcohol dehydrogenase family)